MREAKKVKTVGGGGEGMGKGSESSPSVSRVVAMGSTCITCPVSEGGGATLAQLILTGMDGRLCLYQK